ncbi:MAG TPA: GNAT family N-acetyltransferase [Actinomycetes bacterium]|nr:GNAT family N-acetyltransferase [Actinomycetes bacterium]
MLSTSALRVLGRDDLDEADAFLARDPVANVFIASRVQAARDHAWRLGGELWGYVKDGRLSALCYAGANLVPAGDDPTALQAFADRARRQGRRCSSMVGVSEPVENLWALLGTSWGPAREVRRDQPLLAIAHPPDVAPDEDVRQVRDEEFELILPACIDMFTEEVGVSPMGNDGGALYRARVKELVASGRAFARIVNGKVLFKAEIGAASRQACQVQGVWVHPEHRGTGLSAPGMSAVVTAAQESVAPTVSLYVNGHNEPARRAYEQVGFEQVGRFTTILF